MPLTLLAFGRDGLSPSGGRRPVSLRRACRAVFGLVARHGLLGVCPAFRYGCLSFDARFPARNGRLVWCSALFFQMRPAIRPRPFTAS